MTQGNETREFRFDHSFGFPEAYVVLRHYEKCRKSQHRLMSIFQARLQLMSSGNKVYRDEVARLKQKAHIKDATLQIDLLNLVNCFVLAESKTQPNVQYA